MLVISIEMPPTGELETSDSGFPLTEAQMAEEMAARQKFLDLVSPLLGKLPNRPFRRGGNISRISLHGASVWSRLNRYVLLIDVDIGVPPVDQELRAILPAGAKVTLVGGDYSPVQIWTRATRPRANTPLDDDAA